MRDERSLPWDREVEVDCEISRTGFFERLLRMFR